MEHLEITVVQQTTGPEYHIQVWDHYWTHKLGDNPDRTYIRRNIGKALYEIGEEMRAKRSWLSLPNR